MAIEILGMVGTKDIQGAFSDGQASIPLSFGGASAAAVAVGAGHADIYLLWGEPLAQITERITQIRAVAAGHGRTVRFSLPVRPGSPAPWPPTAGPGWTRC